VRHVLVQEFEVATAIAIGILQLGADLARRFPLPRHLDRSQTPSRVTGNAFIRGRPFQQRIVRLRVASHALVSWPAYTSFAAHDRRQMRMLVVALQRSVAGRMTVHAARTHDHLRGLAEQCAGSRLSIRNVCERGRRSQIVAALGDGARAGERIQQSNARCQGDHCAKQTSPLYLRSRL
jgi:hypothetical protein